MRFLMFAIFGLVFCGCATKEPKMVYKDVFMPVKCVADMPKEPANDGSFEAHKATMIYLRECESILKQCVGKVNE